MAKVAFLGLGVMGYPMAGHLLKKGGHDLSVYNRTAAKAQHWAKEYGGKHAPTPREAALRPEARHRVCYRNCLPLEQPAGHRKANCRVAQVHYFHRHPPLRFDLLPFRGGTSLTLSAQ